MNDVVKLAGGGFEEFPKIARLNRGMVVTEKIDGTNGQVFIVPFETPLVGADESHVLARNEAGDILMAGSRNRYITPAADNFGFAAWVKAHAAELWSLGPGRHFGEWWGPGIQRGYGLKEKRFSLFNVARWADDRDREKFPQDRPACCDVVPVLLRAPFSTPQIHYVLEALEDHGSVASPGFMRPEGVVVWHEAARTLFKVTLEGDDEPKSRRRTHAEER